MTAQTRTLLFLAFGAVALLVALGAAHALSALGEVAGAL